MTPTYTSRRSRAALIALLLVALWGSSCSRQHPPEILSLTVALSTDHATVLRSDVTRRVLRAKLVPIRIRDDNWTRLPTSAEEIAVAFHDADGRVTGQVAALPGESFDYVDYHGRRGEERGGRVPATFDVREVRLPLPRDARHVSFVRLRVTEDEPASSPFPIHTALGDGTGRFLTKSIIGVFSTRLDDNAPPGPRELHLPGGGDRPVPEHEWNLKYKALGLPSTIDSPSTVNRIRDCGAPFACYNIVVLGDGFATSDALDDYETHASALVDSLLAKKPLSEFPDLFNVFLVRQRSIEPGTSCCGDADTHRDTYYGVRGEFFPDKIWEEDTLDIERPESGTCLNHPWLFDGVVGVEPENLTRILTAAEPFVTAAFVDLFIVIANCQSTMDGVPTAGGRADRDSRMAFVTLPKDNSGEVVHDFFRVGVHEAAHVIGDLADEYMGCILAPSGLPIHLSWMTEDNVAFVNLFDFGTTTETHIMNVPWRGAPGVPDLLERYLTGEWRHLVSSPTSTHNDYWELTATYAPEEAAVALHDSFPSPGMYWGNQYLNPFVTEAECEADLDPALQYKNPQGSQFYRAESVCLMRHSAAWPYFCVACQNAMRQVFEATGPFWPGEPVLP